MLRRSLILTKNGEVSFFVYLKIAVSVYVGGVDENVHVALLSGLPMRVLVGISRQSFSKALN